MTGRERLLKALKGEETDRIPVTLFIQSQGHFAVQLDPEYDPWNFEKTQKSIIDYQRSLGLDVHVRMLFFNPYEPVYAHFDLLNFQTETDTWKVEKEEVQNGSSRCFNYTIHTPEGDLEETFSINEERPGIFMYACTKPPIKTERDLELAMKYEPPYAPEIKEKMKKNVQIIREYLGEDGIISAWGNGGLFNNVSALIDQTELYALFLTDPEFYGKLMEFARKRVYDYTDALLDSGVDALCVAGNVAGGFLGNNMFEQYILPYEKEYIAYCQRTGNPVIYHNCGRAMELIPAYKKMGAMNIEPFSPKPLGNTDLNELSSILNGEFSVTSGVDQVHVLQQGTVEEVERVTAETMEKGKKFKSFIMQNVDFLEYGTPMENVEAYARTALKIAKGE